MIIRARVIPESKKEIVEKIREGTYKIMVRPKAINNAANDRAVALLKDYFPDCRGIRLLSGATRPQKTFEIIEPIESLF